MKALNGSWYFAEYDDFWLDGEDRYYQVLKKEEKKEKKYTVKK